MDTPQQPELERSGRSAVDPSAAKSATDAPSRTNRKRERRFVPEANRPGHHPETEEDRADADAVADALGIASDDATDDE